MRVRVDGQLETHRIHSKLQTGKWPSWPHWQRAVHQSLGAPPRVLPQPDDHLPHDHLPHLEPGPRALRDAEGGLLLLD